MIDAIIYNPKRPMAKVYEKHMTASGLGAVCIFDPEEVIEAIEQRRPHVICLPAEYIPSMRDIISEQQTERGGLPKVVSMGKHLPEDTSFVHHHFDTDQHHPSSLPKIIIELLK